MMIIRERDRTRRNNLVEQETKTYTTIVFKGGKKDPQKKPKLSGQNQTATRAYQFLEIETSQIVREN